MTFANPNVMYFLLLVPVLVMVFVISERKRNRQVAAMAGPETPVMVMGARFERRLIYLILLCLGIALLVMAAARPQWGTRLDVARSRGIDILIAIDVSESMLATDVSPSRIAKARQEVNNFLKLLDGDRVGLIAFAGSAYTYVPLTVDYSAVRLFLDSLEPGSIEDAGTDIGKSIEEAIKTFERSESTAYKILVVFSDGEHHEANPLEAVAKAVEDDIQIYCVGIGNVKKSGERIPLVDNVGETTYKVDQQNKLVITRLDEETLTNIATQGGGEYYRVSEAGTELVAIYKSLDEKEDAEFSSRTNRRKEDRFQIPLLIAVLLLTVAYSLGTRSFKKLRRTQGVRS